MKTACERCTQVLPPETSKAWICSYECTFCADCATEVYKGRCPNCGGELLKRPARLPRD
ncbi:MAG: DUF1272 domain-containing protein [Asticcacaulis sp.]